MKKDEKNCQNCQHFTGIDGVGEMWISCNLHGDFKVQQRNCPNFKKKVTKLDLLREIRQLKEENEQLREKNKQIGYLKRDLYRIISATKDTPFGECSTMREIRER